MKTNEYINKCSILDRIGYDASLLVYTPPRLAYNSPFSFVQTISHGLLLYKKEARFQVVPSLA